MDKAIRIVPGAELLSCSNRILPCLMVAKCVSPLPELESQVQKSSIVSNRVTVGSRLDYSGPQCLHL